MMATRASGSARASETRRRSRTSSPTHGSTATHWRLRGSGRASRRWLDSRLSAIVAPIPVLYHGYGSPRLGNWPRVTGASTDSDAGAASPGTRGGVPLVMTRVEDAVGTDGMRDVCATILKGRSPYDRTRRGDGDSGPATDRPLPHRRSAPSPSIGGSGSDIVDEVGFGGTPGADPALAERLVLENGIRQGTKSARTRRGTHRVPNAPAAVTERSDPRSREARTGRLEVRRRASPDPAGHQCRHAHPQVRGWADR